MNKEQLVNTLIDYHENLKCSWDSPYSHFELMYNMLIDSKIFNPSNIFESLKKLSKEQLESLYASYIIKEETPIVPVKEDCKILEFK